MQESRVQSFFWGPFWINDLPMFGLLQKASFCHLLRSFQSKSARFLSGKSTKSFISENGMNDQDSQEWREKRKQRAGCEVPVEPLIALL